MPKKEVKDVRKSMRSTSKSVGGINKDFNEKVRIEERHEE